MRSRSVARFAISAPCRDWPPRWRDDNRLGLIARLESLADRSDLSSVRRPDPRAIMLNLAGCVLEAKARSTILEGRCDPLGIRERHVNQQRQDGTDPKSRSAHRCLIPL